MKHTSEFDLVHIHELWHFPHWAAVRAANRAGVPYIITPHGEMNPPRLAVKTFKKKLFIKLFERKAVNNAAAVQTLNDAESTFVKRVVPTANTIAIPNGSDHLENVRSADKTGLIWLNRISPDDHVILFLGRLHQIKGIQFLAETMRKVLRVVPNAHLIVAGPDSDGSGESLQREADNDDHEEPCADCGVVVHACGNLG